MKAILFVNESNESMTILKFLSNKDWISSKLKKVKINLRAKEPYLQIKDKKIIGITKVLLHLQDNSRPLPKQQPKKTNMPIINYEEHAYKGLYGDGSTTAIPDDDETTDDIKARRKQQAEEQYRRHTERIMHPSVPKRVPIEEPIPYTESIEEKKEEELYDYYKQIMGSSGD